MPNTSPDGGRSPIDSPRVADRTARPYWPALDGWRGFTIWFAISVHAGYFTAGGVLSLDTFFVLSGFLITGILLREWLRSDEHGAGRIALPTFWARRARRLLPGLFVVLGGGARLRGLPRAHARARPGARRRLQLALLLRELALHRLGPVLLLDVHRAVAGAPPVVARGGGAVLPVLAADRPRHAVAGATPVPCRGCGRRRRSRRGARRNRVRRAHGLALRTGQRSVARVLRHRHACAGDARRRGAGRDCHAARSVAIARRTHRARSRRRSVPGHRGAPLVRARRDRSPRPLLRPLRPARVLRRHRRGAVAVRATVIGAGRARARMGTGHLGGRDLLRDVPVALAALPRCHTRADGVVRGNAARRAPRVRGRAGGGHSLLRGRTDPSG